jgi:hypothetical protein
VWALFEELLNVRLTNIWTVNQMFEALADTETMLSDAVERILTELLYRQASLNSEAQHVQVIDD